MKGRIECNMPQHSKSTPHQCPRQQLCFKPALTDICINAPKCLLALLPLIFDRRFTVSVSRDPPSLFSLIAQLAFHGPLWQLQPLRKAEVIPPLLLQPCIEKEVCGRDSMQQNVNARSGLSHGNQVWDPGIFCARMRDDGGLYFFFLPLPFWKIIFEPRSSGSLLPCGCQIFPQDWFLHLHPHLHCCAIPFHHVQLVIMGLSWLLCHR